MSHDGTTPETAATPWDLAMVVAEVRNALVPARHFARTGNVDAALRGIERVLGMATAIDEQLAKGRP